MLYVWMITVCANVTLALFLVVYGYYIRFGYLTLWTISAVAIDAFGIWATNHHIDYTSLFNFSVYCWNFLMMACVIWEGIKWGEKRVRIPVEFQLFLGIVTLTAHRLCDAWTIYYAECFGQICNLLVIGWMIWLFRKEPRNYVT